MHRWRSAKGISSGPPTIASTSAELTGSGPRLSSAGREDAGLRLDVVHGLDLASARWGTARRIERQCEQEQEPKDESRVLDGWNDEKSPCQAAHGEPDQGASLDRRFPVALVMNLPKAKMSRTSTLAPT